MRRTSVYIGVVALVAGMVAVALPASAGKPPAPVTPVVQLEKTAYSIGETGGAVSVRLVRNTNTCGKGSRVHVTTYDGTAVNPGDYTSVNADVSIPPCSTSQVFTIPIADDNVAEVLEKFTLQLTAVNQGDSDYAQVGKRKTGTVTITDDDPCAPVSLNDRTVAEGNSTTFTVTAAAACALPMQVTYTTGTTGVGFGHAVSGTDYTHKTGNVAIPSGSTTATFSVSTIEDLVDEPNETFKVVLSNEINTSIDDGTGVATITDDDGAPNVSVGDADLAEGNAGTSELTFLVSVPPLAQAATVDWTTAANGSATAAPIGDLANTCATAGNDYVSESGTLNIPASAIAQSLPIAIDVCGDVAAEIDDTFSLLLSNPTYVGIDDGTGIGTIENDDTPTASASNESAWEGDAVPFTIDLSAPHEQVVTVDVQTWVPTVNPLYAQPVSDYTAQTVQTLVFLPGQTSKPFNVATTEDAVAEDNEFVYAEIVGATNAVVAGYPYGDGLIKDDEAAGLVASNDAGADAEAGPEGVGDIVTVTALVTNMSGDALDGHMVRFEIFRDVDPEDGDYDQIDVGAGYLNPALPAGTLLAAFANTGAATAAGGAAITAVPGTAVLGPPTAGYYGYANFGQVRTDTVVACVVPNQLTPCGVTGTDLDPFNGDDTTLVAPTTTPAGSTSVVWVDAIP